METHIDAAGARDRLFAAAREAGDIALRFFRPGERTSARVDHKEGGSPVTEADLAVNDFLRARLGEVFAGAGWLSEESEDDPARLSRTSVLIVDPIDGTRGFLAGDPRWAVSVALIVAGRPLAGVVHAPALAETYAAARGCGATLNGATIGVSQRETLAGSRIAGPKAMIDSIARAANVSFATQPKIPSLAYRMALVASGELDLAVGSEKAHDWDIAAVDLILEEAGGWLVEAGGAPLRYNNRAHAPRRVVRRIKEVGRAVGRGGPTDGREQVGVKTVVRDLVAVEPLVEGPMTRRFRPAEEITMTQAARSPEPSNPETTSPASASSGQLLHLVFGGELTSLDFDRISRPRQNRRGRRFPRLCERRAGVAGQGAILGR